MPERFVNSTQSRFTTVQVGDRYAANAGCHGRGENLEAVAKYHHEIRP